MQLFFSRICTKIVILSLLLGISAATALELRPKQQSSSEGYYTLRWEDSGKEITTLEMSPSSDFGTIETQYNVVGMSQISVTGYTNGQYYFRLVDSNGVAVGNPASVTVEHRSLEQALQLFGVGCLLFLILVSILLFGPRQKN
ncbi:MAG: hypothetical protein HWE27_16680 [Gammaproteobacteria bacterium]|nr:hypothetical protein [Gammaproteobacteria bacterium]